MVYKENCCSIGKPETFIVLNIFSKKVILSKQFISLIQPMHKDIYSRGILMQRHLLQYNHVRMINVVDTVKLIKFCFVYAIVLFTFSFASFFLSSSPPSSSSSSSSLLPKASNNLPSNNIKQL